MTWFEKLCVYIPVTSMAVTAVEGACFLSWPSSFLSEHPFCVAHWPSRSAWGLALYGLLKFSVMGLHFYNIYTSVIGPLLTATSMLCHLYAYADSIQAYLHCLASSATAAVLVMNKTLGVLET